MADEATTPTCRPDCQCACNGTLRTCACHFPASQAATVSATDEAYPCARCGADSLAFGVRAINKDGRTLDLCGDHTKDHRPALDAQKWTVIELRVLVEAALQAARA